MAVICDICEKIFNRQQNLNRHKLLVHKIKERNIITYAYDVFSNKCLEGCEISFKFVDDLRNHLKLKHNFEMLCEELNFNSENEFNTFFSNLVKTENAEYTISHGPKLRKTENFSYEKRYYNCNRSGVHKKPPLEGRKRALKTQGNCKINKSCTSQIVVTKNIETDSYSVVFFKTHYGHALQLEHLRVPLEDRKNIAVKLAAGVSTTKLLDSYRDNITGLIYDLNFSIKITMFLFSFLGEKLERKNLITRRDVINIKNAFNISIADGVRHADDAKSVDLWVNSEQQDVIYYKKQSTGHRLLKDEDFCLIIMTNSQQVMLKKFGQNIIAIDSTHGINNYDFELTTLVVVDEFREGFPVACMFSNRKDTMIMEIFFDALKTKVGVVQCKVFMTDITTIFYNAWAKVMGPTIHLFCSWHVDQAWQKNLKKIRDVSKRNWIYKLLKVS